MSKEVVILGAGYAGILTAKKLAKRIKKTKADVNVTIIDRNPFHTMLTELHEVAAGRVDEDSITISLAKVFAKRKVNVVLDNITSVDYASKVVKGEAGEYKYDYFVMAAGSKPTYFGVEGAAEHAHKLWSYQDAVDLHHHIQEQFRKARLTNDPDTYRRLLTFYVVGAGFTGVEMIGELAEWVPILCEKFEIPREDVKLMNVDVLNRVVPTLSEKSSVKIQRRMEKMGISVLLGSGVCKIAEDHIEILENNVCVRYESGTTIWAAGIEASDITAQAGESLENTGRGRIKTDKYLVSISDPSVYVAGDNVFYIPEGEERPIAQMVEMAEHAADTVSHNLMVDLLDPSTAPAKFKEKEALNTAGHGVMVCVGGRWGAAEVGTNKKKFRMPSFIAMFIKHFINIVYFLQVAGWNKIMSYLRHEFFTIRNRRSFVGGHFSNRTPSFVLVLLRMWLGAVWVFEGVKKIIEGWFDNNMLANFFNGANAWYASLMQVGGGSADIGSSASETVATVADAASSASETVATVADAVSSASQTVATTIANAADAVSSATGAVADVVSSASDAAAPVTQAAGQMLLNWNFGLFRVLFAVGKDPAHAALGDYALKIDVPLMNWFLEKFILPSNGLSMFMQIFIVVAEILVGLALMGGFLTTPVAVASIVLQAMFLMTTGLYLNNIWMIFASIAMLFGAGKVFGMDYYLQPPLKRAWKKNGFAKKWYLYND